MKVLEGFKQGRWTRGKEGALHSLVVRARHKQQTTSTFWKASINHILLFRYYQLQNFKMVSRDEMRKKRWEEEALLELLFTSPNSVTEDDLKSISLSNLAKNMNDELPSRTLMKTYIRWLEAHRKCPTHLIKTWPNTIKQWVESLKNRGFAKEEVISDFENWKKVNRSITRHSEGLDEGKWHPSADDIDRAFGEKHTTKRERSSDRFQTYRDRYPGRSNVSKSSLAFVPKSYVCNRCGKHGMTLFEFIMNDY